MPVGNAQMQDLPTLGFKLKLKIKRSAQIGRPCASSDDYRVRAEKVAIYRTPITALPDRSKAAVPDNCLAPALRAALSNATLKVSPDTRAAPLR